MGDLIRISPWNCKEEQELYNLVVLESVQPLLEETLAEPCPVTRREYPPYYLPSLPRFKILCGTSTIRQTGIRCGIQSLILPDYLKGATLFEN